MGWLFEKFSNWIDEKTTERISSLTSGIIDIAFDCTDGFWDKSVIDGILNLSATLNLIVFVITILFLLFDILEENGKIEATVIFANIFKAISFTAFNRYIAETGLYIAQIFTVNLKIDHTSQGILETVTDALDLFSDTFINTTASCLILIIAFISFFFTCLSLNGSILTIICSSSLYIPSIIRGDTAKMGDWIRVLVSVLVTFLMKYVFFYLGISFLCTDDLVSSLSCFIGMFAVPKLLQNYGLASSSRGVLSSATMFATQGLSMARGFVK
ncbi:MAG: DUF6045 family protein [Oscillospiraceae bacterium]